MQTLCNELIYPVNKKLKDFDSLISDKPINRYECIGYIKPKVIRIKCNNIFDLAVLQLKKEKKDYNNFDLILNRAEIIKIAINQYNNIKELYKNIF